MYKYQVKNEEYRANNNSTHLHTELGFQGKVYFEKVGFHPTFYKSLITYLGVELGLLEE